MTAPLHASYEDALLPLLKGPTEAAAYIEAVLNSMTPPRCWWHCDRLPKRTEWPK